MRQGSVLEVGNDSIATTAGLDSFNFGGPVVDSAGRVIGMNTVRDGSSYQLVGTPVFSRGDPAWISGGVSKVTNLRIKHSSATSVTVAWAAPLDGDGYRYVASATTWGQTSSISCMPRQVNGLSCKLEGLETGVPYRLYVHAWNSSGESGLAALLPEFTPKVTVPDPPPLTSATWNGRSQTVVAAWAPPSNRGGGITAYEAMMQPLNRGCTTSSTELTCSITGVTNPDRQTVQITAENEIGRGAPSDTQITWLRLDQCSATTERNMVHVECTYASNGIAAIAYLNWRVRRADQSWSKPHRREVRLSAAGVAAFMADVCPNSSQRTTCRPVRIHMTTPERRGVTSNTISLQAVSDA